MKKEDLILLKEKLSKLSEKESKLRDLYLKDLATGKIQGPKVGYATIDKPWLKYVDVDKVYENRPKRTVYQEIYEVNKNRLESLALEFFGAKIKYKKLFENIDKVAANLVANGVKKGDFITICSAGNPELVYLFYAISKIGAVANFIPPYFNNNDIAARINDCNSKMLFVMDIFYDDIKEAIPNSSINKVIVTPLLNSSPVRFLKRGKKIEKNSNQMYWNDFIKSSKINTIDVVNYEESMPVSLIYSSGSTGDSKSILLTNDSFQNSVHSYDACGIDMNGNQKYYQIIPPWFSTGLSTSIHLPLSKGAAVFMDPRIDKKVFVKNIIKHKINATVATATMYDGFVEENIKKNVDLSHFNNGFSGGEPYKKSRKESVQNVLHEHGCNSNIKIGYGQCESGSGITTQTDDFDVFDESVGIPIPGVVVGVYDDDYNELPYNQKGQVLARTDCAMSEYYKNPVATAEYFHWDQDGRWSCTGDLGSVDEDGMIYIYGRQSDYSIIDDKKIYNFDVEKIIMTDPDVQNCAVITMKCEEGDYIAAHIVFKEEFKKDCVEDKITEKLKCLQQLIYNEYSDISYVPSVFKVRDSIPTAKSSKRDTRKLKSETEGFIVVDKYNNVEMSRSKH